MGGRDQPDRTGPALVEAALRSLHKYVQSQKNIVEFRSSGLKELCQEIHRSLDHLGGHTVPLSIPSQSDLHVFAKSLGRDCDMKDIGAGIIK